MLSPVCSARFPGSLSSTRMTGLKLISGVAADMRPQTSVKTKRLRSAEARHFSDRDALHYVLRVSAFTFRTEDNRIKFPLHIDLNNFNGRLITYEGQRYDVLRAADFVSPDDPEKLTYIIEKVDQ